MLRDRVQHSEICEADQCILYDGTGYGDYVNKHHTIKIQTTTNGTIPTILNRYHNTVKDYGVRELQTWLSLAPLQTCKLIVIHNIHRLTSAGANAMLKILEEPLNNRMIIATTDSMSMLLPTIVSRAQFLHLHTSAHDTITTYLRDRYPHLSQEICEYIIQMSGSAIGIATTLADAPPSDIVQYYHNCKSICSGVMLDVYQILQSYAQKDQLAQFLTLLQSYTDLHQEYLKTSAIAHYHHLIHTSVNSENALMMLSLKLSNHI